MLTFPLFGKPGWEMVGILANITIIATISDTYTDFIVEVGIRTYAVILDAWRHGGDMAKEKAVPFRTAFSKTSIKIEG